MVNVRDDLTGKRFKKLAVLYQTEDYITSGGEHRANWHCRCDCGNEIDVADYHLKGGDTTSCGCYRKQRIGKDSKMYNRNKIIDNITIIYTSKGEEILIDTEVFINIPKIREICWSINKHGYAVGRDCDNNKVVFLHDIIMKPNFEVGECVDHIYGKRFDNRISELRIATYSQNNQNKKIRSDNTSGVIGVYLDKRNNKWYAQITINNKTKNLGSYQNFDDAVNARLVGEQMYFGEFAPQKHLFEQYGIN